MVEGDGHPPYAFPQVNTLGRIDRRETSDPWPPFPTGFEVVAGAVGHGSEYHSLEQPPFFLQRCIDRQKPENSSPSRRGQMGRDRQRRVPAIVLGSMRMMCPVFAAGRPAPERIR